MSEFRQNFVTKEWVIIAPERGRRPDQMRRAEQDRAPVPAYREDCPFCPGHEDRTPEPTYLQERAGQWQVRVVPNKFGALAAEAPTARAQEGPFLRAGGFGVAEVVIESPHHDHSLELLPLDHLRQVLLAYRSRHLAIASDSRVNLVTLFRNYGPGAGTSLEHPHSQMHFDTTGRCAYCEMLEGELASGRRVLMESEHFVAFAPFAAKTPFESRIYPKRHHASYSWINDRELADFAVVLKDVLLRLRHGLGAPDYNFVIRSATSGDEDVRYLHWYLVIIPKVTTAAGFEIGTGIYINVVTPESAAEFLRSVEMPGPV